MAILLTLQQVANDVFANNLMRLIVYALLYYGKVLNQI
jgi:hypothetical protein